MNPNGRPQRKGRKSGNFGEFRVAEQRGGGGWIGFEGVLKGRDPFVQGAAMSRVASRLPESLSIAGTSSREHGRRWIDSKCEGFVATRG